MQNKKTAILFLITVAVFFYTGLLLLLGYFTNYIAYYNFTPDYHSYLEAADLFLYKATPHYIRPYGIAAFHSIPFGFGVSGDSVLIFIWLMQFLLWLAQIIFIFQTISLFAKPKIAFLGALLFLINCSNIIFSTVPMSETLTGFLLSVIAYLLGLFFFKKRNYNFVAIACMLLCVLSLVRPTFFYLSIFSALIVVFICFVKHWRRSIIFVVIGLFFIGMQCYKMNQQFGNYTVSYIDKLALITYMDIRAKQYANKTTYTAERERISNKLNNVSNFEMSKNAIEDFKDQVQNNTFNFCKAYMFNMFENSSKGNSVLKDIAQLKSGVHKISIRALYFISTLQNILYSFSVLLLLPFCYYWQFKKRQLRPTWFTIIIYFICISTILLSAFSFFQFDRFHVITVPLVLILLADYYCGSSLKKERL
jgi:hypothetical protein